MLKDSWQEFSTDNVLASLRTKRWAEFGSETLSEMQVDPLAGKDFRASMKRKNLGPLGYVMVASSPAQASSRAAEAGAWASNGSDHLMMTVVDSGRSTLKQANWSADLKAGDIVIRDLSKPWESSTSQGMGLILIKIPFTMVAKYHPDPERLVGHHLPSADPRVAFASTVIRASRTALEAAPDANWQDHLSEVLVGVFRLICHNDFGADTATRSAAGSSLKRSATMFILRNLCDPELTVERVATAMGVTSRHLQRAFMDSGATPRQLILDERLKEAARLMTSGSRARRSILEVAFAVGFNDGSHFTKAFTQKFGRSPSAFRQSLAG